MSKIICDAYFSIDAYDSSYTPIAVSASFQAALTPWILTMTMEKYSRFWSVPEIELFSRSPTFQFTRSLSVYFRDKTERHRFMTSQLCAPLISHLQKISLSYHVVTTTCKFNKGAEVAEFILKFDRLEKLEMFFAPSSNQTPPSQLIGFYNTLFHSQSIRQVLLVSVIESFSIQMQNCSDENYASLIKQHKIIPYLAQKTVQFYRNDHGETLCMFLQALQNSFIRSEDDSTEIDSIDELVPVLDLIETIVLNGDLLHPCFQTTLQTNMDLHDKKWHLARVVSTMLYACLHEANYSRLAFMQRYGRTLLPQLADFIRSKYDGSRAAADALSKSTTYMFGRLMDNFYWTDEVESARDTAEIEEMLDGGHKLLWYVPFEQISFAIAETVKLGLSGTSVWEADWFSYSLTEFCKGTVSQSEKLRDAVVRDVSSQIVQHNILAVFIDFLALCFEHHFQEAREVAALMNCVRDSVELLNPTENNQLSPIASVISKDFFSQKNVLKIINFCHRVCNCLGGELQKHTQLEQETLIRRNAQNLLLIELGALIDCTKDAHQSRDNKNEMNEELLVLIAGVKKRLDRWRSEFSKYGGI